MRFQFFKKTTRHDVKNNVRRSFMTSDGLRRAIISFKNFVKDVKLPLLLEFFKWKFIDLYRFVRYGKQIHLYGIRMLCGLYGQGKTMALTQYLDSMRKKYGDKIYICTNYFYLDQDFPLTDWKVLLKDYDKPVIFGYDEIQNEFNSRDYQNFPYELLTELTQNRKGHGKQIICTAQRFNRVDKIFRELCQEIGECRTLFGRYTRVRWYDLEDYEQLLSTTDVNLKRKIRPIKRFSFVQTDRIRNKYDSFKKLDSARHKQYISRQERRIDLLS